MKISWDIGEIETTSCFVYGYLAYLNDMAVKRGWSSQCCRDAIDPLRRHTRNY